MEMIRLSPSKLNLFNESPRCFWDAYAGKVPRPRGIFPSLPGGMDLILKKYCDRFRGSLPPRMPIENAKLFKNMSQLNSWRHWRTGLTVVNKEHQFTLIGAIDDLLYRVEDGKVLHIPMDYKTKGSMPKDDGSQYYQTQVDCYNYMLLKNGLDICNEAWLVYYFPEAVIEGTENNCSVGIKFGYKPYQYKCDANRAEELCIKAANCLRGPRPEHFDVNNDYIKYIYGMIDLEEKWADGQN